MSPRPIKTVHLIPDGTNTDGCFTWLALFRDECQAVVEAYEQETEKSMSPKQHKELVALYEKAEFALKHRDAEEWISESLDNGKAGFALKPLTVRSFANKVFQYGQYVLLMSATVLDAQKMAESLGLGPDDYEYVQTDCPFPVENRQIVVSSINMSKQNRHFAWPKMVEQIQLILDEAHPDEKGLLLTTSNEMLDYILKELKPPARGRLIPARGEYRLFDYNKHVNSKTPTVLAAPGFWEGADLKNELARFAIIPTLPRPYWGGRIEARAKLDPVWYRMLTCQQFIQGTGRTVRSETDYSVTYVLDQELRREADRSDSLLPEWFKKALVYA